MAYTRVIPRDLFNESSLLKCLGRLWICLENTPDHRAEINHDGNPFEIVQDGHDGSIFARNVRLTVRGQPVTLSRPLNSRDPWPLWAFTAYDEDEIEVFTDEGNLHPDFVKFIQGVGA